MKLITTYEQVEKTFNPRIFRSLEEYEAYFLQRFSETRFTVNHYTNKAGEQIKVEPVNHFPKLKKYSVWMEGFNLSNGQNSGAKMLGEVKARNFAQACHLLMCRDYIESNMAENAKGFKGEAGIGRWDYDPSRLQFWGCNLHWSEELAKRTFG